MTSGSPQVQINYTRLDLNTHIMIEIDGLIDTKGERSRVALRWNEGSAEKYVAGVVELGDTLGLGPSGITAVGVRVPPPAPTAAVT